MKDRALSTVLIIAIGALLLVIFLIAVYITRDFLIANAGLIVVAKDLVSILGFISIVIAAGAFIANERARRISEQENEQKRQANRSLERVKLSIDLMSRFYEPKELEEIRRSLREHKPLSPPAGGHPKSLRWDEVWVMNFFETLAIGVDEGLLDIELVNKMFGSPIVEVAWNPRMRKLVYDAKAQRLHSYEGYVRKLYLPICQIRGIPPAIKVSEEVAPNHGLELTG